MHHARLALIAILSTACLPTLARGETVSFTPVQDTTIFDNNPDNSNGSGGTFFVGHSGPNSDGLRRALILFDLSAMPAYSELTRATLTLRLADVPAQETSSRDISLHLLEASWGEAGSAVAPTGSSGSGNGAPAEVGDATWNARFYDPTTPTNWSTPGGEFIVAVSATATVGLTPGDLVMWETTAGGGPLTGMLADVEAWLNSPAANFGWILVADDEAAIRTVRRFNSREEIDGFIFQPPVLEIEFIPVPEPAGLLLALPLLAWLVWQTGRRIEKLQRRQQV